MKAEYVILVLTVILCKISVAYILGNIKIIRKWMNKMNK